jgi:transcriptional regulator with XRE-family HTH domain
MESLGAYLRRKREERGRTVEDLARETRIQAYLLNALENDDLASLPHPAFVRGFVRNVCRAIGAPEDRALELYEERLAARDEAPAGALPRLDASGWAARVASGLPVRAESARLDRGRAEAERSSPFPKGLLARRGSRFSPMIVAVVALLAFVVLFFAVKISGGAMQEDRTPTVAWPAGGTTTSAWSQTAQP